MNSSSWSPAPGLVVLAWAGAVGAAAWLTLLLIRGADAGGVLFAATSALGLGVAALFGTRARPRLSADADGLSIRGLVRHNHHPWPLVRNVQVRPVRRLGRDSHLLEVDAVTATGAEHLAVFGRLDLAADPFDVAARITAIRSHVR